MLLFELEVSFEGIKDGNPVALEMYNRHYSAYQYKDGRVRKLFCGPGEKMVLLSINKDALFVWRKFIDKSGQQGINCAVFRNEGSILSSDLIKEAVDLAKKRWKNQRFYTYVNAKKIKSTNPGYCFQKAGWKKCGTTKGGLIILELDNEKC
jgi:hypothetical protein